MAVWSDGRFVVWKVTAGRDGANKAAVPAATPSAAPARKQQVTKAGRCSLCRNKMAYCTC